MINKIMIHMKHLSAYTQVKLTIYIGALGQRLNFQLQGQQFDSRFRSSDLLQVLIISHLGGIIVPHSLNNLLANRLVF